LLDCGATQPRPMQTSSRGNHDLNFTPYSRSPADAMQMLSARSHLAAAL
jgi:hypothetical protein